MTKKELKEKVNVRLHQIQTGVERPGYGDELQTDDSYEARLAAVYKRMISRSEKYVTSNFQSKFEPYYPLDDPMMLVDDVYHNGVLYACNDWRASAVGRLGHHLAENPFYGDQPIESEKANLNKWILNTFQPSFQTAMYRRNKDYYNSGMGALLIDHNQVPIKDPITNMHMGYEISMIRHINRLRIIPLKPEMIVGENGVRTPNPQDILFPRWLIKTSDDTWSYAKSFGDPRNINRKTGDASLRESYGTDNSASIQWKSQYHPKDEICGWPDWYTEKMSIEISWLIQSYEWGHFITNCIPNLIIIMPEVELEGGGSLGPEVKKWLQGVANKREDSYSVDHRSAMVIEFPIRALQNVRHLPMLIQEIKGPDANQFLDMAKAKNQRIAIPTGVPPALIHAERSAMGSGSDKEADLARTNELHIIPEQETEEIECLDKILMYGTRFRSWVIRLNRIDTSDPEKAAKVAEHWSKVWFARLAELRAMNGLEGSLSDDATLNQNIGNIMLMPGGSGAPMTVDQLWELAISAAQLEAENPNAANEVDTDDEEPTDDPKERVKRFTRALDRNFGTSAEDFLMHGMPVIDKFIAERTK